jgi:2-polyprenyl-6-methoxyphenol hydroxylase-like FAD-dependent oxidoreductase
MANHFQVVIAGAGPTGLTMSGLLARMRIKHLIVEKAPNISTHPMAHYVNVRTMEILRSEFGIEKHVHQLSPPRSAWEDFVWCTSVAGRTLFRMTHKSVNVNSFCESTHLSQNKITPYLLEDILKPENSSHSNVKFNCAIENFKEEENNVSVQLSNGEVVKCDYLVAADGANSRIRSKLNIPMIGKGELQTLMNIHFKCPPGLNWSNNQAAMLFFVYNPKCVAVFVAHDLVTGEWVCQVPFFPPFQTPENSFSLEQCKQIVVAGLGVDESEVKILSAAPWTMDAKVAKKYSSDSGRVLLAGDAVHRFPPAGGFGMNTGVLLLIKYTSIYIISRSSMKVSTH